MSLVSIIAGSVMQFEGSSQYRRVLARGAAVLVVGGLAAGCSSDVMRFDDNFLASSSAPNQAMPVQGGYAQQPVDQTSTASIAQAGHVAGGQYANAPVYQQYPAQAQQNLAQAQQYPAQVQQNLAHQNNVTRSTLNSVQQAPAVVAGNTLQAQQANLPAAPAQLPSSVPAQQVAVLPQQPQLPQPQRQSTPAGTASNSGTYKVVPGDTLNAIARKTGVSVSAIKQANGLSDGLIRVGQTLTLPAGGVAAPATQVAAATPQPTAPQPAAATTNAPKPETAAYTPPKQSEKVIQQASLDTSATAPNATGISGMRWPVRGRVISGFGSNSGGARNDGIDIAVPSGTPIKAAENGVVIYAGDGLKEFGNTVLVRHENGLVTVYGHASELKVQRGQKVRRGEDIALAGMSGSADTPRLHFEVRKDSSPVDPSKYLE